VKKRKGNLLIENLFPDPQKIFFSRMDSEFLSRKCTFHFPENIFSILTFPCKQVTKMNAIAKEHYF
jgi:hypothetical protein